ncbi:MAG: BTAD domain-containing putative transcriptional regulator [Gemmatimonadaceae bacterium]
MLVLELLGTVSLRNETPPVPVSAQQKRSLGLLAILALAGRQGFPRDRIEAYLWPESSAPLARHSLDQTVYAIRHALGSDFILSTGRELRLNPDLVQVDAWEFEDAIRARQWAAAVERYKGTLLDGFHFSDSREAESWIDAERARLLREYQKAVEFLAKIAADAGDHAQSVIWWRRLANSDPLSASATKHLMMALAAAGDRAGAVKQARLYQELVRQELEIEPDPEIERLAATLSNHAIAETSVSRVREEASHDRLASAAGSHDSPPNRSTAPSAAAATVGGKGIGRGVWTLLYAVTAFAILMAGVAIRGWMRPAPSKPEVQYPMVFDSAEEMVRSTPWSGRIAISPDGTLLAYIGGPRSQLLIRPRGQLHATLTVPGSEGAASPFFSPDGKHVGFLREGIVQIAPVSGGPPSTVSDSLTGVAGASWGRDEFIYADGSDGLVRVEAKPGAVPRWFTTLDTAHGESHHSWPDVLPNGKGVLFTVGFSGRNGSKDGSSFAIAVADIPSGKHHPILPDAKYARYAKPGYLLYVTTNKVLMAVAFDQNSMTPAGEPFALAEGMRLGLLGSADLAVDTTGTLIYATGAGEGKWELVWVTRDGREQAVDPGWAAFYLGTPTLSPDGKSVAEVRMDDAETPSNIWIKRLGRGRSHKLTVGTKDNGMPAWTPDGKSVTFISTNRATGATDLSTQRADGSAQAVTLFHGKSKLYNPRWSPDEKWLLFTTDTTSRGAGDIFAIRPGIDTVPVPVVATRFTEISPAVSPNGRWLAYVSNETGKDEIYVVPFPKPGTAKWAISTGGGTEPVWSHRGSELFYRDTSGNLVAAELKTSPTFSLVGTTVLFPAAGFSSLRTNAQYAVAPDDRRFLMVRPLKTTSPDKLIFVQNWIEELKTRR